MKTKIILSIALASLIFGCGSSSDVEDFSVGGAPDAPTVIEEPEEIIENREITVERGPVIGSVVTDSSGNIALYSPSSKKYIFTVNPRYPIKAEFGYIDINRNGMVDIGEYKLEKKLTAISGDKITVLTSMESNAAVKTYFNSIIGIDFSNYSQYTSAEDWHVAAISDQVYAYIMNRGLDIEDLTSDDITLMKLPMLERLGMLFNPSEDLPENESDLGSYSDRELEELSLFENSMLSSADVNAYKITIADFPSIESEFENTIDYGSSYSFNNIVSNLSLDNGLAQDEYIYTSTRYFLNYWNSTTYMDDLIQVNYFYPFSVSQSDPILGTPAENACGTNTYRIDRTSFLDLYTNFKYAVTLGGTGNYENYEEICAPLPVPNGINYLDTSKIKNLDQIPDTEFLEKLKDLHNIVRRSLIEGIESKESIKNVVGYEMNIYFENNKENTTTFQRKISSAFTIELDKLVDNTFNYNYTLEKPTPFQIIVNVEEYVDILKNTYLNEFYLRYENEILGVDSSSGIKNVGEYTIATIDTIIARLSLSDFSNPIDSTFDTAIANLKDNQLSYFSGVVDYYYSNHDDFLRLAKGGFYLEMITDKYINMLESARSGNLNLPYEVDFEDNIVATYFTPMNDLICSDENRLDFLNGNFYMGNCYTKDYPASCLDNEENSTLTYPTLNPERTDIEVFNCANIIDTVTMDSSTCTSDFQSLGGVFVAGNPDLGIPDICNVTSYPDSFCDGSSEYSEYLVLVPDPEDPNILITETRTVECINMGIIIP